MGDSERGLQVEAVRIPPEARAEVLSWFEQRSPLDGAINHLIPDVLAWDTGFWVPDVGAGFLICTNSAKAFIEDFVTNPNTTPEQRDSALFAIERAIVQEARRRGFRYLMGFSPLPVIWRRVARAGYVISDVPVRQYGKRLDE